MANIKGQSDIVKSVLRFIDEDSKMAMDEFYYDCLNRKYIDYEQISDITPIANNDLSLLQAYCSFNYCNINNALRDKWTYEENGNIENKNMYIQKGETLDDIIKRYPVSYGDFKVYRGTTLHSFKDYGIETIEDLKSLQEQYLFDRAFVSTSLKEEDCYFGKNYTNRLNNIEIVYYLPKEFNDGIYLGNTYGITEFKDEKEYLINRDNLAKVANVTINGNNTAVIEAVMIPKYIYDKYYQNNKGNMNK